MAQPELTSGFIRAETRDGILRVTIDRADKRNALTRDMYEDMSRCVEQAGADDSVRTLLIDSEGDMFCAGNDVAEFAAATPDTREAGSAGPALSFIKRLRALDKPVVIAVQGQATGIGTTMLLHADLVVGAESARFFTAFIDLALVPEAGSSLLLPGLIGRQNAARLLLAHRAHLLGERAALAVLLIVGFAHLFFEAADMLAQRVDQWFQAGLVLFGEGTALLFENLLRQRLELVGERLACLGQGLELVLAVTALVFQPGFQTCVLAARIGERLARVIQRAARFGQRARLGIDLALGGITRRSEPSLGGTRPQRGQRRAYQRPQNQRGYNQYNSLCGHRQARARSVRIRSVLSLTLHPRRRRTGSNRSRCGGAPSQPGGAYNARLISLLATFSRP